MYLPKSDILSANNQSFVDLYEEYLWNEKAFLLHIDVCGIMQNPSTCACTSKNMKHFFILKNTVLISFIVLYCKNSKVQRIHKI